MKLVLFASIHGEGSGVEFDDVPDEAVGLAPEDFTARYAAPMVAMLLARLKDGKL